MSTSVVVVSYNTASVLRDCLASVQLAARPDDDIIVVDNASSDGTPELVRSRFPGVRLAENDTNRGFAAAANQGVRLATRRNTLILNPDTVLDRLALEELERTLARYEHGALIGPQLLNADGSVQRSAFRFPSPVVLLLEQLSLAHRLPGFDPAPTAGDDDTRVDWLKGACLLAPTSLLLRYGPFDERFFMFGEDVDLCYRLRRDAVPVVYCPRASVVHLGGMSTRRAPRRMAVLFVVSTYRWYRLHHPSYRLILAVAAIRSVVLLKLVRAAARAADAIARGRRSAARLVAADVLTLLAMLRAQPPPRGSSDGARSPRRPDSGTPAPRAESRG